MSLQAEMSKSPLGHDLMARIADEVPVGIGVVIGDDLVFLYANDRLLELSDRTPLLGRRFADALPDVAPLVVPLLNAVRSSEEPRTVDDIALPASDGSERYFAFRYSPFEVEGARGVLIESTETTAQVLTARVAEDARAEAERVSSTLSNVFESMTDGFMAFDPEWRFTYINGPAEMLLHACREDVLGQVIWQRFPDLVGSVYHEQFHAAMREQRPIRFEEYYGPNDMWASFRLEPSPSGLAVYLSNITSLKQAEAALGISEAQLRAIIDNSPAVIYLKDLDGRLIRVNDEFVRRFGLTKDDVVGKTDFDLLPEETARAVRENDLTVLSLGTEKQFEEEVDFPDGSRVTYLTTKFPLRDLSGRVYGTAGISTNIEQRKRQERALAASEQRFRKIFEEGPLGVAIVDTSLAFRQVNDRYAQMLGYTKDEMVGKTIADVTPAEDRNRAAALPHQLLRGEIPHYRLEKRYVRRDGSLLWASVNGSLIRDDGGEPMFILSLVEDITQRKAAEDALHDKDRAIREAYSSVIAAVTGGKLVLMTPAELDAETDGETVERWHLDSYAELGPLRRSLGELLERQGVDDEYAGSFVLASCEAATNGVKHGSGAEVSLCITRGRLQLTVTDHGPGINFEHLPRATLVPGYSTAQSLGMGFTIMLEIGERVLLSTQPGYTAVALESPDLEKIARDSD